MTRPTTTGKAQDLITFTRSTTGTALAKISSGEELVTNGDFSNGTTGWNFQTETPESGRARLNNTSLGNITYYNQTAVGEVGKVYVLTYDVLATNGATLALQQATNLSLDTTTTGSKRLTFNWSRVGGALTIKRLTPNTDVTVNNISVKEVLYDRPDGTLQLLNHPINKPRIEYDAEGNCLGLLVEEARTNLVTQSEFASGFLNYHITLTRNQTASPDTNINAGSAVPTAVNTEHYLECVLSSPSSGTYTQSVFVKANGYSKVALTPVHIGADQGATSTARFDLTEGTSTQIGSAVPYISNLGNGWYRIAITYTATGTVTNHRFRVQVLSDSYGSVWQANGADGIYVYGAQLETGSFPTSYIPTSGSAVTRSADVASLAVSKFGYNQDQFSVVVESDFFGRDSAVSTLCYIGESGSDRVLLYYNSQNINYQVKSAGSSQVQKGVSGNVSKSAYRYKLNDMVLAGDGNISTTETSANLLSGAQNNIYIGGYFGNGGATLNGHIKSIQYYPLGLSNAQLQALTS